MTQKRNSDRQSIDEDEGNFAEQLKNLTNYAHTEINNLYSLIDGLDKKVLHIEIQENYQSQYSINERLDKLERHEMQAPLSYDDVIDIKRELNELKKLMNDTQNKTISNTKHEDEFKNAMNDETTSNDSSELKDETKSQKHLNSYSAPLHRKSGDSKIIKKKSMIPVPPSSKSKKSNSPISDELIKQMNEEQKEINKLDSEAKKALNNSYDAKAQASEASYVATKAKDQASEANSKVDELSSHDKKVDTKIKHIKSKVRKLSRKVDDIETSTQSEITNENENSEKTGTEKVSNSETHDTEKVSNSEKTDTEKTSSEKSQRKENSKSEKSEKKEKTKIGKLKPLKLKIGKKKEKNEEESSKKKINKTHMSEKSSKKENH